VDLCTQSTTYCASNAVTECSADGDSFSLVDDCGSGSCDDTSGVAKCVSGGGGSGGAAGSGGSTGGTGGSTGGTGGTGGTCTTGLIDDMESADCSIPQCEARIGGWYVFNDDASQQTGTTQWPTPGPGCTYPYGAGAASTYGIHTYGYCETTAQIGLPYGAAVAVDLNNPGSTTATKLAYNASGRGYTGLRFWARREYSTSASTVYILISDVNTDPLGGKCTTNCYNDYRTYVTLSTSWQEYTIYWNQLTPSWSEAGKPAFAANAIYTIQWRFYPGDDFNLYVDNVEFVP
jgi:hypothetical protein